MQSERVCLIVPPPSEATARATYSSRLVLRLSVYTYTVRFHTRTDPSIRYVHRGIFSPPLSPKTNKRAQNAEKSGCIALPNCPILAERVSPSW